MLNISEALRAHARCKSRFVEQLRRPCRDPNYLNEFTPHRDCVLIRFIEENKGDPDLEPELSILRTAHATVHTVAIGLAQKYAAGQIVNLEAEFAPNANFGGASSSLVSAIWRLEKKLHSMAR